MTQTVTLSVSLTNNLLSYLATRPFSEVSQLLYATDLELKAQGFNGFLGVQPPAEQAPAEVPSTPPETITPELVDEVQQPQVV